MDLNQCEFWVQVHRLPFVGMNRAMATLIGNNVGSFINLDMDENNVSTVMRIRVSLDVTKPLSRFMNMEGLRGQTIRVSFTYEKLFVITVGLLVT